MSSGSAQQVPFTRCERHRRGLAGKHVPSTLLPNGDVIAGLAKPGEGA